MFSIISSWKRSCGIFELLSLLTLTIKITTNAIRIITNRTIGTAIIAAILFSERFWLLGITVTFVYSDVVGTTIVVVCFVVGLVEVELLCVVFVVVLTVVGFCVLVVVLFVVDLCVVVVDLSVDLTVVVVFGVDGLVITTVVVAWVVVGAETTKTECKYLSMYRKLLIFHDNQVSVAI